MTNLLMPAFVRHPAASIAAATAACAFGMMAFAIVLHLAGGSR
jgi:hypothetical protein